MALALGLALVLAGSAFAEEAAPKPPIHSRASWGALEEVDGRAISSLYGKDSRPDRITLHHTDIPIPPEQRRLGREWLGLTSDRRSAALAVSRAQAAEHVRRVQALHLSRGWNDVGYHFMIDWMGRIYAGRPVGALGAHTEEENRGNIGIALLGDMEHQDPSMPQQIAVERLVRWLTRTHRIRSNRVMAHRDYANTDCPGKHFYPMISKARRAAKTAAPSPEGAVTALLEPWKPGRPSFADSRLAQRVFDGLLAH